MSDRETQINKLLQAEIKKGINADWEKVES